MSIFSSFRAYGRNLDLFLFLPFLALVIIGLLAVYSATGYPESTRSGYILRHAFALPLATLLLLAAMGVPVRTMQDISYPLYGLGLVLLVAVLFIGQEVHGARRWLVAGPMRMQPAEFAKICTVLAVAHFLVGKRRDPARLLFLFTTMGLFLLPMGLVLKEPDLGTSGAFACLGLGMLIWSGVPLLYLFLMLSPLLGIALCRHTAAWVVFILLSAFSLWRLRMSGLVLSLFVLVQVGLFVGAPKVWERLEPYQRSRIETFLDPSKDPAGAGYQILQSKVTIGSGGIWGKGYFRGTQKALAFLPQQHTDFIFGVVGEEFGFLGSSLTILLFFILIGRGYFIALHCRNPFAGLMAVGVSTMLLYHAGVNMAMTVGLLPVTGLPLPLLSYGGSFLASVFIMVGLLLNISAHRYEY